MSRALIYAQIHLSLLCLNLLLLCLGSLWIIPPKARDSAAVFACSPPLPHTFSQTLSPFVPLVSLHPHCCYPVPLSGLSTSLWLLPSTLHTIARNNFRNPQIWSHSVSMRRGRSLETDRGLVVARGWAGDGDWLLMRTGLLSGMMEMFWS